MLLWMMLIFILMFILSISNLMLSWLFMTMLSMLMTMIISKSENKLKYFFIQEASILSMLFFVFKNMKQMIIMPLFLKMGLVPLHTWMMEIFILSMKLEMMMFISLAKVMPAIIIMSLINPSLLTFIFLLFIFSQLFPILYQNNTKIIVFFSSLINFFLFFIFSFNYFMKSFYLLIFYIFFILMNLPMMKNMSLSQLSIFFIFLIVGIPISPVFFMKMMMFFFISFSTSFLLLILISTVFYFIYIMMLINQISQTNKTLTFFVSHVWHQNLFSLTLIFLLML